MHAVALTAGVRFADLVTEVGDRVGQDSKYHLDTTAIKAFGWEQTIRLGEGLARMVQWVRKYPELLTMETTYRHCR